MQINGLLQKDNPFDYIVLGFIMKLIGSFLAFFISYHFTNAFFGVISWILIIQGFSRIPGRLSFPFTGFYKFLLSFFLLQCVVMILRGYLIDYEFIWFTTIGAINYHLFQSNYLLCYLMPFVALIPIRYFNFRLVLNYSIIFAFITLVLSFIFRNEIINSSLQMASGMVEDDLMTATDVSFYKNFAFLPLLYYYIPSSKWRINMMGLSLTLLLAIIGARRGNVLLSFVLLVGALYFRAKSKPNSTRIIAILFGIFILAISAYFVLHSTMSGYLLERGLEDSRSAVEDAMLNQMSTKELIIGKGLNGRYFFPILEDDYLNGWRYVIETGFYNLVLKGGYLLAISYVLLLVIPAYKGLFNSNNLFCKAGGLYILYNLISLWPFGILAFRIDFFFLWMMIVCCMNKEVRVMTNDQIKKTFFYNIEK